KVVIGNPPWRNQSKALKDPELKEIIQKDLIPFAHEYNGEKLSAKRGCTSGVREEYIFFYGVANRLIDDNSMVCYITNESWLMALTYRLVRRYFVDNYRIKK